MSLLPTVARRALTRATAPTPLSRFAPGAALGFVAIIAPISLAAVLTSPATPLGLGEFAARAAGWTIALCTGYQAMIRILRPTLHADAEVSGRRSVVAGAASAGAVLVTCMLLGPAAEPLRLAAAALCGAGVAFTMFWPWRMSRIEREALRSLEP